MSDGGTLPFTPAAQDLDRVGLTFDEPTRKLVDPETGEVFPLEAVVDEATAKAATYRIFCNSAAEAELKRQKQEIAKKQRQRADRHVFLLGLYKEGICKVAADLLATAKGQSLTLGFAKVGYAKARARCTVRGGMEEEARWCLMQHDPRSLRLELDLDLLPEAVRSAIIAQLKAHKSQLPEGAVKGDILTSRIPEEIKAVLPGAIFDVSDGAGEEWYVR